MNAAMCALDEDSSLRIMMYSSGVKRKCPSAFLSLALDEEGYFMRETFEILRWFDGLQSVDLGEGAKSKEDEIRGESDGHLVCFSNMLHTSIQ